MVLDVRKTRPKVLVIHALRPSSRKTTIEHLQAFKVHLPTADVQFLHFAQPIPRALSDAINPDLLIVNYDYLNYRFTPLWPYIKNRHREIARRAANVIAIAQDDFWAYELLDQWCVSWSVNRVLTPIDNDVEVLYRKTVQNAEFRTVLTGYAPSAPYPQRPLIERPIDLGQRVRTMPPHLGSYAQKKFLQAARVASQARQAGFVVDVSTRVEDSLIGNAWTDFLCRCKFTVSMKGGASIADPRGMMYARVEARKQRGRFETRSAQELKFLRRQDNKYVFSAISPRLFEAAAAGTCQLLRTDDYLGVLEPGKHYVPLNDDLSNCKEAFNTMRDLDACQEIAQRTQERLIESGEFGYHKLVHAATQGLLDLKNGLSEDPGWNSLVDYLADANRLALERQLELHDAVVHLIHETLSNKRQPNSEARKIVMRLVAERNLTNWFETQKMYAIADPVFWRSPWIWRGVPPVESRHQPDC